MKPCIEDLSRGDKMGITNLFETGLIDESEHAVTEIAILIYLYEDAWDVDVVTGEFLDV